MNQYLAVKDALKLGHPVIQVVNDITTSFIDLVT